MTEIDPKELASLRVMFALRRMAPAMQNDVLLDGKIAARAGIDLSHPIKLPEGITLERDAVFSAFQRAADDEPIPDLIDAVGVKHNIRVEVQGESAFLTYGTHRVRFVQGALLSANRDRRLAVGALCLANSTLTEQARKKFIEIIGKERFSYDDFFASSTILAGAPENFADSLREVANKGTLAKNDFLPKETSHWDNITATWTGSETVIDFIAQELADERAARIARDPSVAVDLISLTFAAPELIPLETMRAIDAEILLPALRRLMDYSDPFAHAGGFDLCADRAIQDKRFEELGDALLERLLVDPKRIHGELTTYATAFVIASAYLAEHETLRRQPVFWRRLAAASHASLVARVLGQSSDDETSLLSWAMRISGKAFYLSVLNDAWVEPRWRPDWISPGYVAADIYGRLLTSVHRIGEAAPQSWRKRLDDAHSSIMEDVPSVALAFPAVLQGRATAPVEKPLDGTPAAEIYERLLQEPTVESFLISMQLAHVMGLHRDAREAALKVVQSLRTEESPTPPDLAQAVLEVAAFVAARNHDAELADAAATVSIERIVSYQDTRRLLPAVSVVVECAASMTDRKEALATLARRLENLAFVAPAAALPEVLDTLRVLRSINEDLSPFLGRAIATARLGMSTVAAV
jgi:hypothetical protein